MTSIASSLKEIGRGRHGARDMPRQQAFEVFAAVLDGQVSELELGAFLMAMRIKAESVDELIAFVEAARQRCAALAMPPAPPVLLPSYNGSRRLPNLTALLAGLLAARDIPVLVHGPMRDPHRVSTAEVFEQLGWTFVDPGNPAATGWPQGRAVFGGIDALCPPLARLLSLRWVLGVRSSGHSVAKLLNPFPALSALRVVNHTHPEYSGTLTGMLEASGADAMLLRGTEGEPVADARRQPRMDVLLGGQHQADLSVAAQEGSLPALPDLPATADACSTASFIQDVLDGRRPAPAPITKQVELLHGAWLRLQNRREGPAHAAV